MVHANLTFALNFLADIIKLKMIVGLLGPDPGSELIS